jgi:hypothetical protein
VAAVNARLIILGISAAAAVALAAGAAEARSFYVVQSGPDAWTVMDPEGIERIGEGGAVRRAWAVRVQRNILTGNPPTPGYVRTLSEYDCGLNRTRWREFSAFSRSGAQLVSKVNPNPEWGPAEEASDTYAAHRVVCEGGGGAIVSAESVAKVVISLMGSWDPPAAAPKAFVPAVKTQVPKAPAGKAAPTAKAAPKPAPPAKTAPKT